MSLNWPHSPISSSDYLICSACACVVILSSVYLIFWCLNPGILTTVKGEEAELEKLENARNASCT